jgi:hypothetical protein
MDVAVVRHRFWSQAVRSHESKSGAILTATRSEYDAQFQRMLQWAIRQKSRKIADGQLLGIRLLPLRSAHYCGLEAAVLARKSPLFRCQRPCYPQYAIVL